MNYYIELFGESFTILRIVAYWAICMTFAWKLYFSSKRRGFNSAMFLIYFGAIFVGLATQYSSDLLPLLRLLQTPAIVAAALFGLHSIYKDFRHD